MAGVQITQGRLYAAITAFENAYAYRPDGGLLQRSLPK